MKSVEASKGKKKNVSLEEYTGDQCKYYYLPLYSKTQFDDEIAEIIGAKNNKDRSREEIMSAVVKAKHSRSSHIKAPVDRLDDPLLKFCMEQAKSSGLSFVLQVCSSMLKDKDFLKELSSFDSSMDVEIMNDRIVSIEAIKNLKSRFNSVHFTVPVRKKLDWKTTITSELLSLTQQVHLYFPYNLNGEQRYLNTMQAQALVRRLEQLCPKMKFLPPKGVDIWDHRAMPDFDMEPFYLPCFETRSKKPQIRFSVVIPTYNNQNHLRVTLKHLYKQNVGTDAFEIIVVDDGGTDQTQELVMKQLSELTEPINFKYVFFPRPRKRVMGDSQYRAGISRNLGVKNAVGETLCFLDSDIVTPADYLEKVEKALETWDALQAKRVNLSEYASHLDCEYEKVDWKKDMIPDEAYWEDFINNTKDWHSMAYNWKYVCTHSFSMKRDLFWRLGGLKKNFIFYGFEDTDLGYRITNRGLKLHLLDVYVFHMFHENARSEFMNLSSLRHKLLSKTAQIFYLHHLDEDVYNHLRNFMMPEPSAKSFFRGLIKFLTLSFLWKPPAPVFGSLHKLRRLS
ncbi:MAG: glycosyltransferase [Bdellovibrionales bacterium]|nr:glycosyltransferase [Bdellovibrionales bacterium]NQZ19433.1 glycosyltransferase [Bdellovibrionales bacterium]